MHDDLIKWHGTCLQWLLNNDLPELTSDGSIRALLTGLDDPAGFGPVQQTIDSYNLSRTLVALRAAQLKASNPLTPFTLDGLKAMCRREEANFLLSVMPDDQRNYIIQFLQQGPSPI